MIIEFVGPSASGKSTLIQNLKENYNLDLIYQSDQNIQIFEIITSFAYLRIILEIYLKIFFTTNLTFSNKRFYSRHITKKIIYFKKYEDLERPFILDEGIINIYLSVLSIHNISIYKIIEKYIDVKNYFAILIKVNPRLLNERILHRGPPAGWDNRKLFTETVNKEVMYYKIQEKFSAYSNDFFQDKEIKYFSLENDSNIEDATDKAVEIINVILN